ncbi:MAG: TetR/AcrR family transcriptional regulator [Chloroflexota bacterium]|nr:MAG: TetR/AcrR family transcriptional regulator [Chloroflexota bacterium]
MLLKNKIIHEAQKLFSLNGFLSTGINDIINAAGTSKGGFYNHFSSKEDLFFAVLAGSQSIWREKVLDSIDEINSPTEKIIKILHNYRDRYLKDAENFPGGCIFITFSVEFDDTNPHLMREVNQGFDGFKRMLTRLLDEAIDLGEISASNNPETVAGMLFTGMLGSSVLYGVAKDNYTLDLSIDSLVEFICQISNKQMEEYSA